MRATWLSYCARIVNEGLLGVIHVLLSTPELFGSESFACVLKVYTTDAVFILQKTRIRPRRAGQRRTSRAT